MLPPSPRETYLVSTLFFLLSNSDCIRLCFLDQLYYNEATASTVADAINSLVGLAGDSVEVTDTGPPGSFEITFKSTRGKFMAFFNTS